MNIQHLIKKTILIIMTIFYFSACTSNVALKEEKLSIAKAQKEIKIGMSSSEVIDVLGSPNMVTTDSERRETWVYDRVSTNASYSGSNQLGILLLYNVRGQSQQSSTNQRTLTIIIKFDREGFVRDFAYRTSTF